MGKKLAQSTTATKIIGYTQNEAVSGLQAVIRAENVEETLNGLRFQLLAPNGRALVETGLCGRFNVSNLLAVASVLIDAGLTPAEVAARFALLSPPPGRLEKIGGYNEPLIVVDYAHTPDALRERLTRLACCVTNAWSQPRCGFWLRRRSRSRQAAPDGKHRDAAC